MNAPPACVIQVTWEGDDNPADASWLYGPYSGYPTDEQVEACRQDFLCGFDVTDAEWAEHCHIRVCQLDQPAENPRQKYNPSRR